MRNAVQQGILTLALAFSGSAAGTGVDDLVALCNDCHGPAGVSANADVPTIAGQSPAFLTKTLRTYQVWGRPCIKSDFRHGDTSRPRTDMCQIAEGLTSEDISALAQHYSALTFRPADQEFDPALAERGSALHAEHCEQCHEGGGTVADSAPILAGQWTAYLRTSLRFVPTGEHLVPPLMERTVGDLSREEIDALMNYYASRRD